MDGASIESALASSVKTKKRKHTASKSNDDYNDGMDDSSPGQRTSSGCSEDDGFDVNDDGILDLTARRGFGPEDCAALGEFLESSNRGGSHSVRQLVMSRLGIGPRGGVALAEPLRTHRTLLRLDLERNSLGAAGACAIFRAVAANTTLRSLNTSLNDVKAATAAGNDEATRAIGEALERNSTLTELLLVRSGLGPRGGTNLALGLSRNRSLQRLDLAGNDVMADGGRAIGEALTANATLTDLNLRWNRIGCGGDRGIASLAGSLRTNRSLRKLDASVNELYCEGAIAFGSSLGANRSLIDLSLERNEIGVSGAVALGKALGTNGTLQRLDLSGNPRIGDEGARAIGESLADHPESALESLHLVGCGVGIEGARAFGRALRGASLVRLRLEKNRIGPIGAAALAVGLEANASLQELNLSRNGIQAGGGRALALALRRNKTLRSLDISNNDIEVDTNTASVDETSSTENVHIVEAIVDHPALEDANISSNALEIVPIDCQLRLARIYETNRDIRIDLSDNPLSSPPLGRRATAEGLRAYLNMLLSDSTAVNRIRLMVLGFGGVGKSTFCDAVTQPRDSLPFFHGSLIPLEEWDSQMIASWAKRLGTHWAHPMGSLLEKHKISGKDLKKLTVVPKETGEHGKTIDDGEAYEPSQMLKDLLDSNADDGCNMNPSEIRSFTRAIWSLMRKGYFSTVGAVKLEGLLELNESGADDDNQEGSNSSLRRACSLVDFAGQMEYLVSHQLLLSSLHTLCVVLQPAPSFGNPESRHSGSWMYWSRFLRALGDRRRGSLLLAISQLDKLPSSVEGTGADANDAIDRELEDIRSAIPNISETPPLRLDYRRECIEETIGGVREALSRAADVVARDWWVPASYEKLAELIRRLEDEKKANREVPIVSKKQLHQELPTVGLHRMHEDPQLFRRGIEYLEAVGDVMTDNRLDCLLLDPISWFASFLAHFIRDDDIVTSVQLESRFVQRGIVRLEDVVAALQHDYAQPREQVAQIMSLVCRLELCIHYENQQYDTNDDEETKAESQERLLGNDDKNTGNGVQACQASDSFYLFPCLLPPATPSALAQHWPETPGQLPASRVYRGYRFRSRSGFFPPGLFPGFLARCRLLRRGVMRSERMWKNCAVLVFGSHTRVLLRIDLREGDAVLDVVGAAPTAEELFVGAAKGQASVVIWMTHLVKMFLRKSYPQLGVDEFFLCPDAECHTTDAHSGDSFDPCRSGYRGAEFPAVPESGKRYRGDHSCEADGCWSQLGTGHKIERMIPKATDQGLYCVCCRREARFALRT